MCGVAWFGMRPSLEKMFLIFSDNKVSTYPQLFTEIINYLHRTIELEGCYCIILHSNSSLFAMPLLAGGDIWQ